MHSPKADKAETRGRKRLAPDESTSKRAIQLREAQRVHREKKALYIKELEDKVRILESEIKIQSDKVRTLEQELERERVGSLVCSVCSASASASSRTTSTVQLQPTTATTTAAQPTPNYLLPLHTLASLSTSSTSNGPSDAIHHSPPTSFSPTSTSTTSDLFALPLADLDSFLNNLVPRMLTSEELYGPMNVDHARLWMKTIPSLKVSGNGDRICDLFVEQSRASDLATAKATTIKYVRTMRSIVHNCTPEDRSRIFDLIAIIQEQNLNHFRYITQFWTSMLPPPKPFIFDPMKKTHQIMFAFQQRFLQVPSLANSFDVVNEFCTTWTQSLDTQEPEYLIRLHICIAKIVVLCSVRDRTNFSELFYDMRAGVYREIESMMTKIEANNSGSGNTIKTYGTSTL
ncbi:hypothetical protein HDU79_011041 [Rhizoclosmatium sp. JEL0117]|nr:hypothetical protein HDU79_011041 [Rhizoclosmatium sp. JEL0117]